MSLENILFTESHEHVVPTQTHDSIILLSANSSFVTLYCEKLTVCQIEVDLSLKENKILCYTIKGKHYT